jgi:hypothetical protein
MDWLNQLFPSCITIELSPCALLSLFASIPLLISTAPEEITSAMEAARQGREARRAAKVAFVGEESEAVGRGGRGQAETSASDEAHIGEDSVRRDRLIDTDSRCLVP